MAYNTPDTTGKLFYSSVHTVTINKEAVECNIYGRIEGLGWFVYLTLLMFKFLFNQAFRLKANVSPT